VAARVRVRALAHSRHIRLKPLHRYTRRFPPHSGEKLFREAVVLYHNTEYPHDQFADQAARHGPSF